MIRKNEGNQSDLPLTISAQHGLVDQRDYFNNQVASRDMSGYYLLENGEFAYNKSTSGDSPWGAIKRLTKYEKGCLSTLYICFGLDLGDPDFLVTYYETNRWHGAVQMIAAEGARNHGLLNIAPDDFFETVLTLPCSTEEQKQIGCFFTQLNSLITLHQRECGKPPFNQSPAWEQRKLGNCGTTYGGLSGKTKEDFGHGNARFVPYTNVFDNPLTDTKRLETVEIDSSQNKVAYGDTFFTVSSETPDEVGMSSVWLSDQDDVYLNSFCFGYRQDSTFDPHYLAYMLRSSSIRSDLTLLAQGISRFNISKNKVMELSVPVPSAAEQKQIGQYFARLDSLITLHQRMCPIFSFCAHGSRTNFAQTLQGWLQILRYPRPIPKMLVSPSAPASGVFGTAKGAFICASSSAGASTSSPSARKNFITSSTLCCRESLSSP